MVTAITPAQVTNERVFPDFVLEAFNFCIQKNFSGKCSTVKQNEVIEEIIVRSGRTILRADVFGEGYLNVEGVYRKQGWKVRYDKPGFNESYDAYYEFFIE